jgi:hypothetical protein
MPSSTYRRIDNSDPPFSASQEASNEKSLNADFVIIVWESSLHDVVSYRD